MNDDLAAVWLTLRLAATTTAVLLVIGTPIAWWLARTRSWMKAPIGALVALPLVLPPTVLGFYLLVAMGPSGPFGALKLPFTFAGLVVGSVFYSLPFVVSLSRTRSKRSASGRPRRRPRCAPGRGTASSRWWCRWRDRDSWPP